MARGRKRTPEHLKPVQRTVRLSPSAFDAAYAYATRRHLSVNAVMQRTLEFIFTHHPLIADSSSGYAEPQSSTLSQVLSESPSSRACQSVR